MSYRSTHWWQRLTVAVVGTAAMLIFAISPGAAAEITLEYDGFIQPEHDILVASGDIGRLESLNVDVGDAVQAGDVIAQMESALQIAEVEVSRYQAAMRGELEAAVAERELSRTRVEQLRRLGQHHAARPDEIARAETELKVAEAKVKMAEEAAQLRLLQQRRQEVELNRRTIRAPVAGRIARIFRQPGEYVSPSEPTLVRLVSTDRLICVFNVPAEEALALKNATQILVTPRSTARPINGVVEAISPAIDGESGTIQVRIRIENVSGRTIPGDRCTLTVETRAPRRVSLPTGRR